MQITFRTQTEIWETLNFQECKTGDLSRDEDVEADINT